MIVHYQTVSFIACCFAILSATVGLLILLQYSLSHITKGKASVFLRGRSIRSACVLAGTAFAFLSVATALAAPSPADDPPAATTTDSGPAEEPPANPPKKDYMRDPSTMVTTKGGFMTGISRRNGALGGEWGLRQWLSKYGASLNVFETSEVLGNVAGGTSQGAAYDGLTQMIFQVDTQRAFRWYGGTFNVSGLQIHGRSLSADKLANLQTASGIEAIGATRLWELWYDQKFGQTGRFDVKVGQQSLDQEFMVSQNALLFVNTMFGWPMLPSADMPGGGPAYPLSALGVRVRARPANSWTVLAGVFNGSPASDLNADSQSSNSSGTSFPLNGGALMIAEAQYAYPGVGAMVYPGKKAPFARVYRFGAWYDTEKFPDQRFADKSHHGDYALYAVADQMVWIDKVDDDRSASVFIRAMGTPKTDRNLIDFSLNAGLTFNELIKHRDDDVFGIGMGYTHVSNGATALDKDLGVPVRSGETFVEASYRYQLRPWYQLQPTFQYVFNPGAGVLNPNSFTGQLVKNEPIIGLRTNFAF
jgi:porin